MKKLVAESLVIFLSIMASFSLESYQKQQKKIEDLNRSYSLKDHNFFYDKRIPMDTSNPPMINEINIPKFFCWT